MPCRWTILFSSYENLSLKSLKSFSAASLSISSPISSLRELWEQVCTRLLWNERGKRSLQCLRTHLTAHLTCMVKQELEEGDKNVFWLSLPMSQSWSCSPGLTSCAREEQSWFLLKTWLLLYVPPEKLVCAASLANAAVVTAKDCRLFEAPQEGLSQNMFFTLSAASKAQVCQIYFPCKLFLHN